VKEKKQVGILLDYKLYKELKIEAVKRDMSLAEYIRSILKNRKNILHNIIENKTKRGE